MLTGSGATAAPDASSAVDSATSGASISTVVSAMSAFALASVIW